MNMQAVTADEALVAQLKQIVGNDHVLTEEKDRDFFSTDLSGRDREIAAVVIQPGNTEELAAGVERQRVEGDEGGRDHVLGQRGR
ncbi:MAG: hypothetical protein GKS03_16225, partial [Alphaproteobacteria bacterium]|nr:hypothetical protein [Alphaproteobacteria bacterium]